jgi:OmpA-OmpF porin, OOP family
MYIDYQQVFQEFENADLLLKFILTGMDHLFTRSQVVKYLQVILLLLPTVSVVLAQNLVPNPSFEDPIDFNSNEIKGWHKIQISDTPDYFNTGNELNTNKQFEEYISEVFPKSGSGFAGIFCFRTDPNREIKNVREFIETPLLCQLEKDSFYRIQVSLMLDPESNGSIKNFGICFSGRSNLNNKSFATLSVKPQVSFSRIFLDDTHNWMVLDTLYRASGSEKYVCLGNFLADKNTVLKNEKFPVETGKKEKWELTRRELAVYYYLDDIIVEKVSQKGNEIINILPDETMASQDSVFHLDEIKIDSAIILKNIVFEFNKSDLLPQSFKELNKLFDLMNNNPEIRVKLEGHTDNIGDFDFNLNLSVERVKAVAFFLESKGIDPDRIEYEGFSFLYPLESNDTEEGRARNRRVSFKIIQK